MPSTQKEPVAVCQRASVSHSRFAVPIRYSLLALICGLSSAALFACSSGDDPATASGGSGGVLGSSGGSGGATGGVAAMSGGTATAMGGAAPASGGSTPVAGGSASSGGSVSANGGSGAATSGGSSGSSGSSGAGAAGAGGGGGAAAGGGAGGNAGAAGGGAGGSSGSGGSGAGGDASSLPKFSFFVTSLAAMRDLSKSDKGFGGDLRFGKATGLEGADEICATIAERSMPGARAKGWRAFLSTTKVNAIDRVGQGPWYDRKQRIVSPDVQGLLGTRPAADDLIVSDLPNEDGIPNRSGTGTKMDDNHDTVTASDNNGKWDGGSTCDDWTRASGTGGPRVGHSWPAQSGMSWIRAHNAPGCAPSVSLVQMGAGSGDGIGNGGGSGGFYCFALMP